MSASARGPASVAGSYSERDEARSQLVVVERPFRRVAKPKEAEEEQTPQQAINEFWAEFTTKAPGKVMAKGAAWLLLLHVTILVLADGSEDGRDWTTTVIPSNEYAKRAARRANQATVTTTKAAYEEVAAVCRAKVARIVKQCRRVSQKYRDPHFDLELDLKWGGRDTLRSLRNRGLSSRGPSPAVPSFNPRSVKRVTDVFDSPRFFIDGPTASDVRQGRDGDCWLLAALCTLGNKPGLIERICVARDEQVGVYGFVFYRDGEWCSEIIDDKLFLTKPDFDESVLERLLWEDRERVDSEEQYRRAYQSGSGALLGYRYSKRPTLRHGDYEAIEGGFCGEGIEDLTGGVTTELYTTDILDKEYFWREELMKVNDQFLFGCSTGMWGTVWGERKGIVELHAYSIMRAVEKDGRRLLLLKNPWGKGEWKGAWSDGSKEWTAEWLTKLNHRFGDDGNFWISYSDLLRKYQAFDRTRLFGPDWGVASIWTTVSVPWTVDYNDTFFAFSLARAGPVVLVLSQLDSRYYRGLEGQYRFELNFRLHKKGQKEYVVRSIAPYRQKRSINVELDLEAGEYTVLMKINAMRSSSKLPIEEVVRHYASHRRDKLMAVGMYDLAHSKGQIVETEEEKEAREAAEKRQEDKEREEMFSHIMQNRRDQYYFDVKRHKKNLAKKERQKARERQQASRAAQMANGFGPRERFRERPEGPALPMKPNGYHNYGRRPIPTANLLPSAMRSWRRSSAPGMMHMEATMAAEYEHQNDGPPPLLPAESTAYETAPEEVTETICPEPEAAAGQTSEGEEQDQINEGGEQRYLENLLPPPKRHQEKEELPLDDESDISSVSELSDTELEIRYRAFKESKEEHSVARAEEPSAHRLKPFARREVPRQREDEPEIDPWNAVATVGLRVYYKLTETEGNKDEEVVKLRIVRPNPYAKKGEDNDEKKEAEEDTDGEEKRDEEDAEYALSKGLDVDDSAKDATVEGDRGQNGDSKVAPLSSSEAQ
ncbi:hypothetical protein F4777DRAFT_576384 [Nemania sp. FL0916]|nr:hypothetical protein F4777DRAFT_576384 [Nemania sp. FL0916]